MSRTNSAVGLVHGRERERERENKVSNSPPCQGNMVFIVLNFFVVVDLLKFPQILAEKKKQLG